MNFIYRLDYDTKDKDRDSELIIKSNEILLDYLDSNYNVTGICPICDSWLLRKKEYIENSGFLIKWICLNTLLNECDYYRVI